MTESSPDMDYLRLSDEQAEESIFRMMRSLDNSARLGYASLGLACKEVRERELWKYRIDPETNLPCRSFTRYIRIGAPYSYSNCFAALADVEELADIPAADLAQIPASNFGTMKQLSTAVRGEPQIIEAAKTKRNEEFVEHVRQNFPLQHVEHKRTLRFTAPESAAEKIEQALEMAECHGATNRNDALELLAVTAIDQWRLEEEIEANLE